MRHGDLVVIANVSQGVGFGFCHQIALAVVVNLTGIFFLEYAVAVDSVNFVVQVLNGKIQSAR